MLTDEDPIPGGHYKGDKMKDVPANYLLWIADQDWADSPQWLEVKEYVEENRSILETE